MKKAERQGQLDRPPQAPLGVSSERYDPIPNPQTQVKRSAEVAYSYFFEIFFLFWSNCSQERIIVPQERPPALELGVLLIF